MKRVKSNRDKGLKSNLHILGVESNFHNILEIKSITNIQTGKNPEILKPFDLPKSPDFSQISSPDSPTLSPIKYNYLLSYIKNLEKENKKIQSEMHSVKEENSHLLRQNKELQIKISAQQNYITRLNVEISKLSRDVYHVNAIDVDRHQKYRSLSRKVCRSKNLIRSTSNSCIERKEKYKSIGVVCSTPMMKDS
ncbi:hypothetical protein SteCoe_1350 [Stentor coeruleus]|uniref:Uncharacterized protein n=1 Tax=Stentor coeruleus TaxID=5963 RepID=A0A1R2D228_9CILI|nr:hypothetical protein SteCoe_1350 [Stentor coeruleus]